jgi:mutator protein MutT
MFKEKTIMKKIVKVAGIITNSRGELVVVSKADNDTFISPGGKIEKGESKLEALKRELNEELSVDLLDAEFFKTYSSNRAVHDPEFSLDIHVYLVKEYNGIIKASGEIESVVFVSYDDFLNKKIKLSGTYDEMMPDFVKAGFVN